LYTSEKEKYYCSVRYGQASVEVAVMPIGNDADRLINFKPVLVSERQFFWVVAPCGQVTAFRHFEVTYCLNFQGYTCKFVN
jgi:hypothetical protein